MLFNRRPKKTEFIEQDKRQVEKAARENKEAMDRLTKAIEKLGPFDGASDILGGKKA